MNGVRFLWEFYSNKRQILHLIYKIFIQNWNMRWKFDTSNPGIGWSCSKKPRLLLRHRLATGVDKIIVWYHVFELRPWIWLCIDFVDRIYSPIYSILWDAVKIHDRINLLGFVWIWLFNPPHWSSIEWLFRYLVFVFHYICRSHWLKRREVILQYEGDREFISDKIWRCIIYFWALCHRECNCRFPGDSSRSCWVADRWIEFDLDRCCRILSYIFQQRWHSRWKPGEWERPVIGIDKFIKILGFFLGKES